MKKIIGGMALLLASTNVFAATSYTCTGFQPPNINKPETQTLVMGPGDGGGPVTQGQVSFSNLKLTMSVATYSDVAIYTPGGNKETLSAPGYQIDVETPNSGSAALETNSGALPDQLYIGGSIAQDYVISCKKN